MAVVYTGFCDSLNCVGGVAGWYRNATFFGKNDTVSRLPSTVDRFSWRGRENVLYNVVLAGGSEDYNYDFTFHESDSCEYALRLPLNNYNYTTGSALPGGPVTFAGSLREARSDGGYLPCMKEKIRAPSMFFSIVGAGKPITASTCSQDTVINTVITVFTGNCTHRQCVANNDDYCGFRSQVTFTALEGETYYIMVHRSLPSQNTISGQFTLDLSEGRSTDG